MSFSQTLHIDKATFAHTRREVSIDRCDVLQWLERQTLTPKFYWKSSGSEEEIAAVGQVCAFSHVPHFDSPPEVDVRLYGGKAFDQESDQESDRGSNRRSDHDALWEAFPTCYFFLPAFELIQSASETKLVIHQVGTNGLDPSLLNWTPSQTTDKASILQERTETPSYPIWERLLLDALEHKELEKVVLARRSSFTFDAKLSPWQLLSSLKNTPFPLTFFGLQFEKGAAFIGATPEILYHRHQDSITTVALAGTRPRGKTPQEDAQLERELLNSNKEGREFNYVKAFITSTLTPLCERLEHEKQNTVVTLATVQHILNRFQGKLKRPFSDATLLKQLHPTPAVGGYPLPIALLYLKNKEPFERGWYAAPIGWMSAQDAEFAVAIRSALICENTAHLFAGTGIVAGSNPRKEWEELEYKMSPFTRLFNG